MSNSAALLSVHRLSKQYSVTVLDEVDFELAAGEIHALLGANGAGKSTLCRILAGLVEPSSGKIELDGRPVVITRKREAESLGIQIVQQELNLVPTLTVAENLLIGRLPHRAGVIRSAELQRLARRALDRVGLQGVATTTLAGKLGVGHRQMIEIAAALDRDCRILILDEPTAALSPSEIGHLFQWLERLRRRGVGIIYISHRLDEVRRLADRITVLRDGQRVGTWPTAELTSDAMVAQMTGVSDVKTLEHEHQAYAGEEVALRVEGVSRGSAVNNVSFTVHRGERLGIAGLVGSGRTELLRAVFGADIAEHGSIEVSGHQRRCFRHPAEAVRAGLVMVTEDRKRDGLMLEHSIRVNTTLCALADQFSAGGLLRHGKEQTATEELHRQLDTRCTSIEQRAATLSGGNQQKVAVAKWLLRDAQVFFFDEPTRGIDVAARFRLYQLMERLAQDGKAIVTVSSDLDELMDTCDRIMVLSAGKRVAGFRRDAWTRDEIMQAAFAGYRDAGQEAAE